MQTSFLSISFRFLLSCLVNIEKKAGGPTKKQQFYLCFFAISTKGMTIINEKINWMVLLSILKVIQSTYP